MNKLFYKSYYGSVEYSGEDDALIGRLLNIKDIVTYEGETVAEIKANFVEAVDGYLKMCAELGQQPDKPASGKFNVRIEPELHRQAQEQAAVLDVSLNDVVTRALKRWMESPRKAG